MRTRNQVADFRDGQEEAIRRVVEGRGRLLVVQKTGGGKGSVHFIAAKPLREHGLGPAIRISALHGGDGAAFEGFEVS